MRLPSPLPATLRYVGVQGSRAAPFGLAFTTDATDLVIAPSASELDAIAAELPAPETLTANTLVVLLPAATSGGLRALFTTTKTASRAARSAALLARGYVALGACLDPHTKLDLVWGRA